MEKYTGHCSYCDKPIKHRSNWIRHCKTKKHLKNILEKKETAGCSRNVAENSRNVAGCSRNVAENSRELASEEKDNETIYGRCRYCDKGFKHHSSLSRHERQRCKQKPIDNQQTANTINNNTNNNCNNTNNTNTQNITQNDNKTINQTININVQGREDHKGIIDSELFYKLGGMEGLKILKLYLDEVFVYKEENNNIKYTNMRSNKCRTLKYSGDDKKWCVDKIDNIIDTRIKLSPMKLNKMMKEHLSTLDKENRILEDVNRQKIYDTLDRVTKIVFENVRPDLLEKEKITPKEKQEYRNIYEDHKITLYNNTD